MTEAMLKKILSEAQAKREDGGEYRQGDGRRLTLYAGHAGVSLTISRVEAIRLLEDGTVTARNDKGDSYFLAIEDLFAVATDGAASATSSARKAGFVG